MSTFVLIPGAGGAAWYWSRVAEQLQSAGHDALAVDLPADDPAAGLPEYTSIVLDSIGGRSDVVLVAQSLGGFTAAMVAAAHPLRALVFVNAMIPVAGESAGDWWGHTGAVEARESAARNGGYGVEFNVNTYFLHDVEPEVALEGEPYQRDEADTVFGSACDFKAWPSIPISVLSGAHDRFFPVEFQRRVAHERLGVEADVMPGGHLMSISQPTLVTSYLLAR